MPLLDPPIAWCCLAVLLAGAVAVDLRSRRIPNRLVAAGLLLAAGVHAAAWLAGGHPAAGAAWWSPLAGAASGLGLLMPFYLLGAMGAGDVKLMAMIGAFVGAPAVVGVALYTLVAGGLLALVAMLGRGVAVQAVANLRLIFTDWALRLGSGQGARLAPLQTTAARLPYALAIALGTAAQWAHPLLAA